MIPRNCKELPMIPRFGDGRDWFFEKRFGMFVHWGIYAVAGWHEQQQWRAAMPQAEYVKFAEQFNPTNFDPDEWLRLAKNAGMEYLVFTTKHLDGFCMWDTAATDFNIMHTPYGRDILAELATACQRQGILLGLYYSCQDWHHPNAINLGGDHQLEKPNPGDQPDLMKYIDFVRAQIRELATNYGRIVAFFWDTPPRLNVPDLNETLRALQPGIVINDRGFSPGDYYTPERNVPAGQAFTRPTEACQSVGAQSWGFRRDEDYFTPDFLIRSMDKIFAMGGNYLLNVGPRPDGTIPPEATAILTEIGAWYKCVQESIVGADPAPGILANTEILTTRRGNTLYLHLPQGLTATGLCLPPLQAKPQRAILLNTGEPVRASVEQPPSMFRRGPCLRLSGLPADGLRSQAAVIRLDFDNGVLP